MLGCTADEVMNKITSAEISDLQRVIARVEALSIKLGAPITLSFEALIFKTYYLRPCVALKIFINWLILAKTVAAIPMIALTALVIRVEK